LRDQSQEISNTDSYTIFSILSIEKAQSWPVNPKFSREQNASFSGLSLSSIKT
jgi:hypothetical protein